MKKNISEKALSKLHKTSELLDRKYGKRGTPERDEFEKEALDYYNKKIKDNKDGNEDM